MEYLKENYHTHTARCGHAVGTDREYVEAALAAGLTTLGFSDHIPWSDTVPREYTKTTRMAMETAPEYVQSIRALQKEYEGRIRILCGFEAEYLPMFWEEQRQMCRDLGVDYLILGQHNVQEFGFAYAGQAPEDPAFLTAYVNACIEAMQTGEFLYIAHPDVIRFTGDDAVYRKEMRRLCREAKSCGLPLEINLLGTDTRRHYPSERFFSIAAEEGNAIIFGIDAHDPSRIGNKEAWDSAQTLVRKLGLETSRITSLPHA